jgi:hypothetical protein
VRDRVTALEGVAQGVPVRAVEHVEAKLRRLEAAGEIRDGAVREVVDSDDVMPVPEQALTEM